MSAFSDRLTEVRHKRGITQKNLSQILGITPTRLNYWEKGKREPDIDMILRLAACLEVSPGYLLGAEPPELNEHISKYNKLDSIARATVDNVIDFEYLQSQKRAAAQYFTPSDASVRRIKLFNTAASAGTGQYLTSSDYELITAGRDVPDDASFAVRITGDSMEPKYHDSQIVYVRSQPEVESGQIGLFSIDNSSYIKRYEARADGDYLISLNPAYAPIKINSWNFFTCFGKVLGQ